MNKIYEFTPSQTSTGKTRYIKSEIINPSQNQQWFYYIETKNTMELESLLKEGFNINSFDPDGKTIAHHAVYNKSKKLLDFCTKHQAQFNINDVFDNQPLNMVSHHIYSLYFFKKVVQSFNIQELIKHNYLSNITFMANHDDNLGKIKFLFTQHKQHLEIFRNDLIAHAKSRKSIKTWQYLSGRDKLITKLNNQLKTQPQNHSCLKI